MPFELLNDNLINTTTQFTVDVNTDTVENMLLRSDRFQYFTVGYNDDNTTASITISFDETFTVNRIAIVGHNLKGFSAYYNGSTANTFSLTATANTTTIDYSSNSNSSNYFRFADVDVTSVTFDLKSTIESDNNKAIGYLVISDKITDFDGRKPTARGYRPSIETQSVVHRLSDGGTRIQTLDDKWSADLSFDFLSESVRDTLRETFDDHLDMVFAPFGTSGGWDGVIFPCVWEGDFEFYQYSESASEAGFSGTISLREVSK